MVNNSVKIQRKITKDEEGIYLLVELDVPENIYEIKVKYHYERERRSYDNLGNEFCNEANIVDLSVIDETGFCRGSSGSARKEFQINENLATPGYISGLIKHGKWNIVLGAYKIEEAGCIIDIEVTFRFKERVLMKGDMHNHSLHSDGINEVKDIFKLAKMQGLNFICLTDHNTISQNKYLNNDYGIIAIPGMEWTHYKGHCNFIGVEKPIKSYVSNNKETTVEIMKEARENGAMVILNHPFCDYCPWEWDFDVPYDAIEVWNGAIKESDIRAIDWWQKNLSEGKKVSIVGGSDNHRNELFRSIGNPTTCVYSKSYGATDILEAVRNGNTFITYTKDGPIINIESGSYIMGDTVDKSLFENLKITATNIKKGDVIKLITDKGEYQSIIVGRECKKIIIIDDNTQKFYRVEIWRNLLGNGLKLIAITNPIYISR